MTISSALQVMDALNGSDNGTATPAMQAENLFTGGMGSDIYTVTSPDDVVDESGGGGLDVVYTSVSFNLADPSMPGAISRMSI